MTEHELRNLSGVELRRRLTQRGLDADEAARLERRRDTQTAVRRILAVINRGPC